MASGDGTIGFVPGSEMLEHIEAHRKRMASERPGAKVSLSDALRNLILVALEQEEGEVTDEE